MTKKLYVDDKEYQAEKIIKTENSITGYDKSNRKLFSFRRIEDFSRFELEEGQKFDIPDTDRIKNEIDDLWQSHLESEGLI